jgi:hypothetical protein
MKRTGLTTFLCACFSSLSSICLSYRAASEEECTCLSKNWRNTEYSQVPSSMFKGAAFNLGSIHRRSRSTALTRLNCRTSVNTIIYFYCYYPLFASPFPNRNLLIRSLPVQDQCEQLPNICTSRCSFQEGNGEITDDSRADFMSHCPLSDGPLEQTCALDQT